LQEWKGARNRHPLLLRGARQVGKTWLVRQHALEYESFLEINLESSPEYLPLFRQQFGKPEKLLAGIASLSGKKIGIGKTLLFIDEIQESKIVASKAYSYQCQKSCDKINQMHFLPHTFTFCEIFTFSIL
jgi:hypothetical protein